MAKYKSFKLYTNQNIMGVVMFSLLAVMLGAVIGVLLLYTPTGQAVLGVSTP
ncbi:MAG: hypothetical protein HYW63_00550 [Candidatus Levybacteria bacterium]|nr:hypothetical protein [Candidatus Levybacteria bacterium]